MRVETLPVLFISDIFTVDMKEWINELIKPKTNSSVILQGFYFIKTLYPSGILLVRKLLCFNIIFSNKDFHNHN